MLNVNIQQEPSISLPMTQDKDMYINAVFHNISGKTFQEKKTTTDKVFTRKWKKDQLQN